MKKAVLLFLCWATLPAWGAEIVLNNGDRITIEANRTVSVVCGGTDNQTPDLPNSMTEGLNSAVAVCGKLYYDSDKSACLGIVGGARYFTSSAVGVCSALNYDSDKKSCIGTIRNKLIMNAEASLCGKQYYDSDKVKCLGQIERVYPQ